MPTPLSPEPDAELLAQRDLAVSDLASHSLGMPQLLLLCAAASAAALGWATAGLALEYAGQGGSGVFASAFAGLLALVFLVASAVAVGFWARRGRHVRDELDRWADLGLDEDVPLTDAADVRLAARLEAPLRCGVWLAVSGVLCTSGLWIAAHAVTGSSVSSVGATVYAFGLGGTFLVTGTLGAVRSLGHQRWSAPLLSVVPARRGGGLHR